MTPNRNSPAALKRLALIAVLILAAIALVLGALFWVGTDGGVAADEETEAEL